MDKELYDLMNWTDVEELVYSESQNPHAILGPHPIEGGVRIQALIPGAAGVEVLLPDGSACGEAEFRQIFFVFPCDLRTLRSGTDEGHIALQNIDKLRELIHTDAAYFSSDPRDPGIILSGGQPCFSIFFCIDAHAPEFQHGKFFSILCQANLPIEDRSAIFPLDQDSNHQHDR